MNVCMESTTAKRLLSSPSLLISYWIKHLHVWWYILGLNSQWQYVILHFWSGFQRFCHYLTGVSFSCRKADSWIADRYPAMSLLVIFVCFHFPIGSGIGWAINLVSEQKPIRARVLCSCHNFTWCRKGQRVCIKLQEPSIGLFMGQKGWILIRRITPKVHDPDQSLPPFPPLPCLPLSCVTAHNYWGEQWHT